MKSIPPIRTLCRNYSYTFAPKAFARLLYSVSVSITQTSSSFLPLKTKRTRFYIVQNVFVLLVFHREEE